MTALTDIAYLQFCRKNKMHCIL